MAMAAALTASSSWSPQRKNVMNDDLASFGQNATSPWRAKMALTHLVHVGGATAACGSPGTWKRKPRRLGCQQAIDIPIEPRIGAMLASMGLDKTVQPPL